MTRCATVSVALWLAVVAMARAMGPHELALIVNTNSPESVAVATAYAGLRGIPAVNVIGVGIPNPVPVGMSREEFSQWIWAPATQAIEARGIGDHILVWVYSVGFPTRVSVPEQMSITGLTFVRNDPPGKAAVDAAHWKSPLFTVAGAVSLGVSKEALGRADMPLPSMMLGYIGPLGNTTGDVMRCIAQGLRSDATHPTGSVWFVTGSDVRARCREWEFLPAANAMPASAPIRVIITNAPPVDCGDLLGIMMGSPLVDPRPFGSFVPGGFADHLTSSAGNFATGDQTKLSVWITQGATASAGTVTEPFAIWRKFPSAWVYGHLASGCTMIESLYQSIFCPLQILPVGEPLAVPYGQRAGVELSGWNGDELVRGTVSVRVTVTSSGASPYVRIETLLDGRSWPVAFKNMGGQTFEGSLDTGVVPPGKHTLRVIAHTGGSVRFQAYAERALHVDGGERSGRP